MARHGTKKRSREALQMHIHINLVAKFHSHSFYLLLFVSKSDDSSKYLLL
jgi:hypothetical protein